MLTGEVYDKYFDKDEVIAHQLFERLKEGGFMNKNDVVKMALVFLLRIYHVVGIIERRYHLGCGLWWRIWTNLAHLHGVYTR